jgi:hypothetical protein
MYKIVVFTNLPLDGVMQSAADEGPLGGFKPAAEKTA